MEGSGQGTTTDDRNLEKKPHHKQVTKLEPNTSFLRSQSLKHLLLAVSVRPNYLHWFEEQGNRGANSTKRMRLPVETMRSTSQPLLGDQQFPCLLLQCSLERSVPEDLWSMEGEAEVSVWSPQRRWVRHLIVEWIKLPD